MTHLADQASATQQLSEPKITVLGIGNPIMGDDGIGLEMLSRLQQIRLDDRIEYVDGGTGGMELLPVVQDASRLLILDAVLGQKPGKVVQINGEQLKLFLATKLSPHQLGLLDVMTAARLLGSEPEILEVVGVVPESVELQLGLTESVAAAIDAAVLQAAGVLDQWLVDLSSTEQR